VKGQNRMPFGGLNFKLWVDRDHHTHRHANKMWFWHQLVSAHVPKHPRPNLLPLWDQGKRGCYDGDRANTFISCSMPIFCTCCNNLQCVIGIGVYLTHYLTAWYPRCMHSSCSKVGSCQLWFMWMLIQIQQKHNMKAAKDLAWGTPHSLCLSMAL
jgi:hypothetical protein